jgi:mercuric ion binding protein
MKRLALIWSALVLVGPAWTAPRTLTLSVPGMSCPTCPITVKKALMQVPGVIKVTSAFERRETTVVFDDAKVDIDALTLATREAGFPSVPRSADR